MSDIVSAGVAKFAADQIWDWLSRRVKVMQFMGDALERIMDMNGHIVVFGQGGGGKTALKEAFDRSEGRIREASKLYVPSTKVEKIQSAGRVFKLYPGQPSEFEARKDEFKSFLAQCNVIGAIHVVSYGYLAMADSSFEETAEFQQSQEMASAKRAWLNNRRLADINYLESVKEALQHGNVYGMHWLLTLVTKADLWRENHEEALDFYRTLNPPNLNGSVSYATRVKEISSFRGADFSHHVCPLAMRIQNLRDRRGEGKPIFHTSGYDEQMVEESWTNFARLLGDLAPRP